MVKVLSLPILAAWSVFNSSAPARVRNFRLVLTLITMAAATLMHAVTNHLVDALLALILMIGGVIVLAAVVLAVVGTVAEVPASVT